MTSIRDKCLREIQNKILDFANKCRIKNDIDGMAFFVELNVKISAHYLEALEKEPEKKFNKVDQNKEIV